MNTFADHCGVSVFGSRIYNIKADYPPTLMLHGDKDTDVPYEQSVQMAAALEQQGIPNQLVTMPVMGHGFDYDWKNPEVKKSFEKALDFLNTHL